MWLQLLHLAACNVKSEIAAYFNHLKILHGFRGQDFLQLLLLCVHTCHLHAKRARRGHAD